MTGRLSFEKSHPEQQTSAPALVSVWWRISRVARKDMRQ
jgi:hypothetical protein